MDEGWALVAGSVASVEEIEEAGAAEEVMGELEKRSSSSVEKSLLTLDWEAEGGLGEGEDDGEGAEEDPNKRSSSSSNSLSTFFWPDPFVIESKSPSFSALSSFSEEETTGTGAGVGMEAWTGDASTTGSSGFSRTTGEMTGFSSTTGAGVETREAAGDFGVDLGEEEGRGELS